VKYTPASQSRSKPTMPTLSLSEPPRHFYPASAG
jgi:hypothetical protein